MNIPGMSLSVQSLQNGRFVGILLHRKERWTVSATGTSIEQAIEAVKRKYLQTR